MPVLQNAKKNIRAMSETPFISIVTVHFQDYLRLVETWESLQSRLDHKKIEWILIDGGSVTDKPEEQVLLRDLSQNATEFISEPDDGIYDAMNKGILLARGSYILFLNAGDTLGPELTVDSIRSSIGQIKPDMIWGKTRFEYPDGSLGIKKIRGPRWMVYGMPICHQSILFAREFYSDQQYDTKYDIAADYELLARTISSGAVVHLYDGVISKYATGGVSQQDRRHSLKQESLIRAKYFKIPKPLSEIISFAKGVLWKISDASPALNRLWRKKI